MGTDTTPDPRAVMEPPALEADYYDEDNQPHGLGVRWDLSWGCKVSVSFDVDSPEQLRVTVSMSDEDHRRGITVRATSREQVRAYATHLLELVGDPQAGLEAGETRTEWGVRYPGRLDVNEWGDDKLGAQRTAEMYRGEHVQRQVGPWVPVEDEAGA